MQCGLYDHPCNPCNDPCDSWDPWDPCDPCDPCDPYDHGLEKNQTKEQAAEAASW